MEPLYDLRVAANPHSVYDLASLGHVYNLELLSHAVFHFLDHPPDMNEIVLLASLRLEFVCPGDVPPGINRRSVVLLVGCDLRKGDDEGRRQLV